MEAFSIYQVTAALLPLPPDLGFHSPSRLGVLKSEKLEHIREDQEASHRGECRSNTSLTHGLGLGVRKAPVPKYLVPKY